MKKIISFSDLVTYGEFKYANVLEVTGMLWWKKTERKVVFQGLGVNWKYLDTGEFTPGLVVENLELAYHARGNLERMGKKV